MADRTTLLSKLRTRLEHRRQTRLQKAYRRSALGGRPGESGRADDMVNRSNRDPAGGSLS